MRLRQSIHHRIYVAAALATMVLPSVAKASDCAATIRALLEQRFARTAKSQVQPKHLASKTPVIGQDTLVKAKADIAWARSHFDHFIDRFKISEHSMSELSPVAKADLPPEVASGLFGAQGNVVIVSDHKRLMALKIIKRGKFETEQSEEFKPDPLIIQKTLSDLRAAPQLFGVVPQDTMLNWLAKYTNGDELYGFPPLSRVKYGVLMELLEAPSIKLKRTATFSGFRSTQDEARARELSHLVDQLGISAMDVDYIYNQDGELMLLDFDHYSIR